MVDLVDACNPLWAAVIRSMAWDAFGQTLRFDLEVVEGARRIAHTLEMQGCEALAWLEDRDAAARGVRFRNWDYYELTSICFGVVSMRADEPWRKRYAVEFNIAVEIWNSVLLIKASEIAVDGERFAVPTSGRSS